MAAILGGAMGNLVDRIFYGGHVVDFIDVGIGTHRFYTFNVADMGVSVGGVVLFLCILLDGRATPPRPDDLGPTNRSEFQTRGVRGRRARGWTCSCRRAPICRATGSTLTWAAIWSPLTTGPRPKGFRLRAGSQPVFRPGTWRWRP